MSDFFTPLFMGEKEGIPIYRMFIGGEWLEASDGELFSVENPQDRKNVSYLPKASIKEAEKAVQAAFYAKEEMANLSPVEKSEILNKAAKLFKEHAEEVIERIVLETGKPVTDAHHEVEASYKRLVFAAQEALELKGESLPGGTVSSKEKAKICLLTRKPLGIVLGITPFNYPVNTAVSKLAPALAAGNTVIIKPASANPTPILYVARFLEIAGLPSGALNVITGGGSELGNYLVEHSKINMISFTGSTSVGNAIAKRSGKIKLHLELGGKCPSVVSQKADLDLAAKESVKGALKFSGQRCDSLSRILVEESIYDQFVEKTIKEVKKWKVGGIWDEETQIGPLIDDNALTKVQELITDAVHKGAEIVYDGNKKKEEGNLLMAPVVLKDVTKRMRIAWEETFGPVVTIMKVKDFEEAIFLANASEYGLDASVFTEDLNEALYAAQKIQAGTVQINGIPSHALGQFPFGGDEESGIGREGIGHSAYEMTKLHSIVFNPK